MERQMACLREQTTEGRGGTIQCSEEGCELRFIPINPAVADHPREIKGDCVLQLRLRAGDAEDTDIEELHRRGWISTNDARRKLEYQPVHETDAGVEREEPPRELTDGGHLYQKINGKWVHRTEFSLSNKEIEELSDLLDLKPWQRDRVGYWVEYVRNRRMEREWEAFKREREGNWDFNEVVWRGEVPPHRA